MSVMEDLTYKELLKVHIYIKRRTGSATWESDWQLIDENRYNKDGIGEISKKMGNEFESSNYLANDNVEITFDNYDGYFNKDSTDANSFWYGSYYFHNSQIKIEVALDNKEPTTVPIFLGLLNTTYSTYTRIEANVQCYGYISILQESFMGEVLTKRVKGGSVTSICWNILTDFIDTYGAAFGLTFKGVSLQEDYFVSDVEVTSSQFDFLADVLKNTESRLIISDEGYLYIDYLSYSPTVLDWTELDTTGASALWDFEDTYDDRTGNGQDMVAATHSNVSNEVTTLFSTGSSYNGISMDEGELYGVPNLVRSVQHYDGTGFSDIDVNSDSTIEVIFKIERYDHLTSNQLSFFQIGSAVINAADSEYIIDEPIIKTMLGMDGSLYIETVDGTDKLEFQDITLGEDQWYYMAFLMDYTNNTITTLINGTTVATGYLSTSVLDQELIALSAPTEDSPTIPGESTIIFDTVRISNTLKTPAQINTIQHTLIGSLIDNTTSSYTFSEDDNLLTFKIDEVRLANYIYYKPSSTVYNVTIDFDSSLGGGVVSFYYDYTSFVDISMPLNSLIDEFVNAVNINATLKTEGFTAIKLSDSQLTILITETPFERRLKNLTNSTISDEGFFRKVFLYAEDTTSILNNGRKARLIETELSIDNYLTSYNLINNLLEQEKEPRILATATIELWEGELDLLDIVTIELTRLTTNNPIIEGEPSVMIDGRPTWKKAGYGWDTKDFYIIGISHNILTRLTELTLLEKI